MEFKIGDYVVCDLHAGVVGHIYNICPRQYTFGNLEYYIQFGNERRMFYGKYTMEFLCTKIDINDLTELDKLIYNI